MRARVFCLITRRSDAELLVFTHRDFPEAGVQVPGGGIEPGETPVNAALREAREETGLSALAPIRILLDEVVPHCHIHAYVCHLTAPDDTTDAWEHTTNDYHDAEHLARGESLVFSCFWVPATARGMLTEPHDAWLDRLASP